MFINPYQHLETDAFPMRTNFHMHAGTGRNTCGHHPIPRVLRAYQEAHYDILCISNHNILTNPKLYRWRTKMLLVPGFEFTRKTHIVCIGTKRKYSKEGDQQKAIDESVANGGFSIIAHPNWLRDWFVPEADFDLFKNYIGIEIINGSMEYAQSAKKERENRSYAGDVYDVLLSKGKLLWAFGNDDFHRWNSFANAWNMIYCEKTFASMCDAVKKGAFYASSGVQLRYLKLEGDTVKIACRAAEYFIEPMRYRFIGYKGEILKEEYAVEGTYALRGDEKYVRVEVTDTVGNMLYTNPIYDDEFFQKRSE